MQIQSLRIKSYRSWKIDDRVYSDSAKKKFKLLQDFEALIDSGSNESLILAVLGISRSTYYRTKAQYDKHGLSGLEPKSKRPPFFVIATQNPSDQLGTYSLPESQLDRFLMCITLGYPDLLSERALLAGQDRREAIHALPPVMSPEQMLAAQEAVRAVHASSPLLDYLQALIGATRSGRWFVAGLSPRAGIGVLRAARARALLDQRDYVAPDDIQAILPQTIAHRLLPVAGAGRGRVEQVRAMVEAVALP